MNCKNCGKETEGNIYCSLKCRNIYVNKNLRDYSKIKNINDNKRDKLKNEYFESPKKCKHCDNIIPFEKRRNSYCDSSCMASYTNKLKIGLKRSKISEEGMINIINASIKRYGSDLYYDNPKKCLNCQSALEFSKRRGIFCDVNCKKEYFVKNAEEYKLYYFLSKFKFNLNDYNKEFDFSLIEENGWYKAKNNGDNVGGASRDHKFSVKEGFRRLINPLLISHPANCELIINRRNQSKNDGCSITIEDLLVLIEKFEIKYGKYYKNEIKTYIDISELKELYKQ